MDDSLPETQTQEEQHETFEVSQQSQEVIKPWGRLSACSPNLASVDLFESSYTCGRAPDCDIILKENVPHFKVDSISKTHFEVVKENGIVYLLDHSKNGTFVNAQKVGKNKRFILNTNDVIALGARSMRAFIFNCNINEDQFLPKHMRKKYCVLQLLGKGAVGEVRFALNKQNSKEYAIKRIIKGSASNTAQLNHPLKIKNEIKILRSFSHPFIIQMKDVHETDQEAFLVLEYMKGGDLRGRILSAVPFPETEVKFVFCQMLQAVQYLHNYGVTHRDLKPENVLLVSEGPYPRIKISDFGLSKIMDEKTMMETICGTVCYAAPEILSHKVYTKKVDVWSLGVILFYMLSKKLPFFDHDRENAIKRILRGKFDLNVLKGISQSAKDLIEMMLVTDPTSRISVPEIMKHPWINQDLVVQREVEKLTAIYDSDHERSDLSDSDTDLIPPPSKRSKLTM